MKGYALAFLIGCAVASAVCGEPIGAQPSAVGMARWVKLQIWDYQTNVWQDIFSIPNEPGSYIGGDGYNLGTPCGYVRVSMSVER